MKIQGPQNDQVMVFGTSFKELTVPAGSIVSFWTTFTHFSGTVRADREHLSLLIRHYYEPVTEDRFHVKHGSSERIYSKRNNDVYKAFLKMESVSKHDSGLYLFHIKYNQLEVRVPFELTVLENQQQDAPYAAVLQFLDNGVSENIVSAPGDSVILNCSVNDIEAAPIWSKDGHPIPSKIMPKQLGQEVYFDQVTRKDSGNYSCLYRTPDGQLQRNFFVNVSAADDQPFGNPVTISLMEWITTQSTAVPFLSHLPATALPVPIINSSNQLLLGTSAGLGVLAGIFMAVMVILTVKLKNRRKQLTELHQELIESAKKTDQVDPKIPINHQPFNLPYDAQYEIEKNQLIFEMLLDEGNFGKVHRGYFQNGKKVQRVAIKTPKNGFDLMQQTMLLSEFKIMARVGNHVNVLRLVAAVTNRLPKGELYVVTEYCEHGSLKDFLRRNRAKFISELAKAECEGYMVPQGSENKNDKARKMSSLKLVDLLSFAYQAANGMDYLTKQNVVHRDVALRNLLLTKDRIVKIGDFGLAYVYRYYSNDATDLPLPTAWTALEVLLTGKSNCQSDIWSFGVVLWEIFTLADVPYAGQSRDAIPEMLEGGVRLPPPLYASEDMYSLMMNCWQENPQHRPSFPQCREIIGRHFRSLWPDDYEDMVNLLNSYNPAVITPRSSKDFGECSSKTALLGAQTFCAA